MSWLIDFHFIQHPCMASHKRLLLDPGNPKTAGLFEDCDIWIYFMHAAKIQIEFDTKVGSLQECVASNLFDSIKLENITELKMPAG